MMTVAPLHIWVELFAATIGARLGLRVDPRVGGEVLQRRAAARGLPITDYLCHVDEPGELREVASELTVGETYFFRHREQLDAFTDVALPARLAAQAEHRQLAILSAGCATGEEPYTLAMLLHDRVPPGWQVALHGVDIDRQALARAALGRYSQWSMRAVPPAIEQRWFMREPGAAVLKPEIRARVAFAEHNLAAASELWARRWDLVFCRNVLMYFTEAQADALVARIASALAPGGYLFLGHAEIVWSRTHRAAASSDAMAALAELETCSTHGTFYYRRRAACDPVRVAGSQPIEIAVPRVRRVASGTGTPPHGQAFAPSPALAPSLAQQLAVVHGDDEAQRLMRALLQLARSGGGA
jgi:chemotaxis protein methyltransferase CheR